ncbi:Endothelial differentiation-related factor 1 [Aphelenchoides bicaudatus]|nr:Endothelial differentiation-related factor 1 [Aphelenchoides bicaudatus]
MFIPFWLQNLIGFNSLELTWQLKATTSYLRTSAVMSKYECRKSADNQRLPNVLGQLYLEKHREHSAKARNPSSDTDFNTVTVLRKHVQPNKTLKTQAELNAAARRGETLESNKKYFAGTNRQHKNDKNTARLDDETEELHHEKVTLELGKVLQQARMAKEWTQKDLGTKINEKVEVIREYENGKAIPNQQVLAKLERTLGVKLRGKEMGQPIAPKPAKK